MSATTTSAADSRKRPLADAPHWQREHFIPIRREVMIRALESQPDMTDRERAELRAFCKLLEATFHHRHHEHLNALKESYAPFNPDDDTRSVQKWTVEERQQLKNRLFDETALILKRANYQRLTQQQIDEAVDATSDWGLRLRVDFSLFDRLEVYSRGDVVGRRQRRCWRKFFREEEVNVPIYQRLVVIFCLGEHAKADKNVERTGVYLKLFKNIPKMDVDMLLPGSRICMTLLDRGKIILPTISGATLTIVKIIKGALLAAVAGTVGIIVYIGFIFGLIGYGVRSFMGYLSTKDRYQLNLTRNLYYQNLDSNAGVFFRLLDEAEDQEVRETLLAYYLLWKRAPAAGWTESELDRQAESFLRELIQVDVDFESHDALDKLQQLGLLERMAEDRLQVIAPATAAAKLDADWDRIFEQ